MNQAGSFCGWGHTMNSEFRKFSALPHFRYIFLGHFFSNFTPLCLTTPGVIITFMLHLSVNKIHKIQLSWITQCVFSSSGTTILYENILMRHRKITACVTLENWDLSRLLVMAFLKILSLHSKQLFLASTLAIVAKLLHLKFLLIYCLLLPS